MTKSMSVEQFQVLVSELDMLRDYTKVLQSENRSRNEQRMIMQNQIQRLNNIIRQLQSNQTSTMSSVQSCSQCPILKSQIIKLQNQIQRLTRQNTNLQSNYNVLSQNLAKYNKQTVSSQSVTTSRITVIRAGNSQQIENSNITLGPTGNINPNQEQEIRQLNRKLAEQSFKTQSLTNQNARLKKQQQKARQLQITLSKTNSQKQSLSIKITTLQQQIHNLKTTVFNKDNQIFNYKTRLQSQTSTTTILSSNLASTSLLQSQLKLIKQSLKAKQNQLTQTKQKISSLSSVQIELRNSKSAIQAKDSEINNLKTQLAKSEHQANNVYKLESQIRNMKYQMTNKDSQMQGLINKIQQLQSGEKLRLQNKDRQISQLKSQISQEQAFRLQIAALQHECKTWKTKFQQQEKVSKTSLTSIQPVSTNILAAQYGEQISHLNIQIARVKTQSFEKDGYIKRIQDQLKQLTKRDEEKQMQVQKLDKIVNSYLEKIGELQNQINKLEKSSIYSSGISNGGNMSQQQNVIQVVNNQQLMILSQENRILNEKIFDQSRRIQILEQTNKNLQQQLRLSIEIRSQSASRLIISPQPPPPQYPDEQLLSVIRLLKTEVQEVKSFNNKLKSDNQYLQAKLSSSELEIQNLTNMGKGTNYVMGIGLSNSGNSRINQEPMGLNIVTTNKILSTVPVTQTNKVYNRISPNVNQKDRQMQLQRQRQWERQKEIQKQRERQRQKMRELSASKSTKKIFKQQSITVLDDKQRDPVTSSILNSNPPKYPPKQKQKKISGTSNKQTVQLSQAGSRNKYSEHPKSNYSKISNISNISPSHNTSNLTQTVNSSNIVMINPNVNASQVSSSLSIGRRGNIDDLQKKIQMLKQENKGLRKHLYEPGA